ncbi:SLBB domain-containing protein [Pseudanabaena sp. FACHB-2040]|uniref:SLBB domain-containing protein n=1 Tax=Pseudanabaena sp. FACHB-2040 TaxID=2692859 RepID=UPI0016862859|nr:SLBB domain-containing protein [Pseudanabaena sp. FACHB-2040]MBD2260566.1 SLBB domain-containing protein [Pseudanabaena sp. FACHB-2040]
MVDLHPFLYHWTPVSLSTAILLTTLVQPAAAQSMSGAVRGQSTPVTETLLQPPVQPLSQPSMGFDATEPFATSSSYSVNVDYRLGPGDVINISVFGAEEYSGQVIVLQDGAINLPRIDRVMVEGLTFQGASAAIATAYAPYIRRPLITVTPVRLRPIRVAISGQVNRPGTYTIESTNDNQILTFPSLTQAISQAGGITARANLKDVEIRRSVGAGQKQVATINLWDLVRSGDLAQDIVLQGGDEVYIPIAQTLSPAEATELATASFAPDSIQIYVAGEVDRPGLVEVPLNTPLNQALLVAGGFTNRANQRSVSLVRLNPDGSVAQRDVPVDFNQGINDEGNPILMNQDVVVVGRSGVAAFGETTSILLSPFTQILNAIFGFRRIF